MGTLQSMKIQNLSSFVFAAALISLAGVSHAQFTQVVLPANISEVEIIRGRILNLALPSNNHAIVDVRVEYANGRILVQPALLQVATPDPGSPPSLLRDIDFDIGRLPNGAYAVDVRMAGSSTVVATASLIVKPHTDPLRTNASGHYWNPGERGWGMMVWNRATDDAAFAVWFTYQDNRPYWVALGSEGMGQREKISPGVFSYFSPGFPVTAFEMRGPPLAPSFDAARVRQYMRLDIVGAQFGTINVRDGFVAAYPAPSDAYPPFQQGAPVSFGASYQSHLPIYRSNIAMELFRP
jgi:hypothetical protein